jgi:hypothetical protein
MLLSSGSRYQGRHQVRINHDDHADQRRQDNTVPEDSLEDRRFVSLWVRRGTRDDVGVPALASGF